jgi:RNA polymerase sigma factor (TIGR02999 family)
MDAVDDLYSAMHTCINSRGYYSVGVRTQRDAVFQSVDRMPTSAPPSPNAVLPSSSVTQVIQDAQSNVPKAINRLFDLLYKDLHRVARNRVNSDGRRGDLSATVILHETYERLVKLDELKVSDRKQFFTYAAAVMRSVVVDMARARLTARRGAGLADVPIDTMIESTLASPVDETVVQIHEALDNLEAVEPRLARVVEMRYFAGLTLPEIAEALELTERTVSRDWNKAKALLAAMAAS